MASLLRKITILALLHFMVPARGQKLSQEQFVADSVRIMRPKLIRPQFKFDNRITFYEGQTLAITGGDAGVLLKDKLRLTAGYYELSDDLNAFRQTIDSNDVGRLIHISYGSLNTEIIYRDMRYLSLGMPFEIGAGYSQLRYKNFSTNTIYRQDKGVIVIAQFGLSATFKPIRWFGLKGILGYRKSVYTQVKEFNFDGFFTSLGLNVDVHEIVRDIKMLRLKRRYHRGDPISNTVDIITN